ncbi:MAG: hypothetical protein U0228_14165 [Myxococcaceae bacterium]
MLRTMVALTLASSALVACSHARPPATIAGPGMNVKREQALFEAAQVKLHCDPRAMVGAFEATLEDNYHSYRVDGCGQRYHAILHCTGVCKWREAPETRAELDLQCPAVQLTSAYQATTHRFTITGCGRGATYELRHGHIVPVVAQAVTGTSVAPIVGPPPPSVNPGPAPLTPPPPPPPSP